MSIDTSLYRHLLRPVRSVAEYDDDAQVRQARAQQMQSNALLMQMQRGRFDADMQDRGEQARRRNALIEFTQSIPSPQMQASQNALAGGGGPTQANAARMPQVDPRMQMLHQGMQAGAVDPMAYFEQAYPTQKPDDFMTVAPGATLVNRRDPTRPVYTAPSKEPTAPSSVQEYQFAQGQGYRGTYQQFQTDMKRAGATSVSVTPTMRQEGAESVAVGKYFGEMYGNLMDSRRSATNMNTRLQQLATLMEGVNTGKLTPALAEVAALGRSLGFDLDPKLDAKQAIEAMSNEMALEMRNPAGGAGMPGALSDKDREFLVKIVPNLGKTPGGNRMIIEARRRMNQREIDVANRATEYRRRDGKLNEGFFEELEQWSAQNPLFDDLGPAGARAPAGAKSGTDLGGGFRVK